MSLIHIGSNILNVVVVIYKEAGTSAIGWPWPPPGRCPWHPKHQTNLPIDLRDFINFFLAQKRLELFLWYSLAIFACCESEQPSVYLTIQLNLWPTVPHSGLKTHWLKLVKLVAAKTSNVLHRPQTTLVWTTILMWVLCDHTSHLYIGLPHTTPGLLDIKRQTWLARDTWVAGD